MKRIILSILGGTLCIFLVILILATHAARTEAEPTEHTHVDYVSALQGECFLCGNCSDPIASLYWGEDNVGIINLNTFELLRLEINRYNEYGQLLDETAGYMQSSHLSGEDSSVHAYTFPDNGYAHVQITGLQHTIDRATIQERLCHECIDAFNELVYSGKAPAEYAIVNFADRTIYPLMSCYTQLSIRNYNIDCEFMDNGSINLVVFYAPIRYN